MVLSEANATLTNEMPELPPCHDPPKYSQEAPMKEWYFSLAVSYLASTRLRGHSAYQPAVMRSED